MVGVVVVVDDVVDCVFGVGIVVVEACVGVGDVDGVGCIAGVRVSLLVVLMVVFVVVFIVLMSVVSVAWYARVLCCYFW